MTAKRKKVCLFTAFYYPHMGGVERYTQQLAVHLSEMGHEVVIVTSNSAKSAWYEICDGIKVYRLPAGLLLDKRLPIPLPTIRLAALLQAIIAEKCDYYILNGRFYPHSLLGAILSRVLRKKSLLIEHGSGHFALKPKFLDRVGHAYEHTITALLKGLVKNYYGVSRACADWLGHFGIRHSGVFYNGIDTTYRIRRPVDIRSAYGLAPDAVIIAFAGRLIDGKGAAELQQAFNILSERIPNIFLFVAGEGPLSTALERQRNESTFLLGKIDYDGVMNLLRNTDIFVLPSRYPEGLPTSLLEAGASNCFVIGTDCGGTAELIVDDGHGEIIRPYNGVPSLIPVLERAVNDPARRSAASAALRNRVERVFDWRAIARNVSAVLEDE